MKIYLTRKNLLLKSNNRKLKINFIIFTIICSTFILIYTLNNAINNSFDFQRSGSLSLLLGYEPYSEFLEGNLNNIFIKNQAPNYLQTLYFLLIPFAILPEKVANLSWGICNISMIISSIYLLIKIFEIKNLYKIGLFILFFLGGFPIRNSIGMGQLSIFVMHSILLGIFLNKFNKLKSPLTPFLVYGLSYLKYSFAPAFATFGYLYFGFKNFLISSLPSIMGIIMMAILFQNSTSIFGPLEVSAKTMGVGFGDLLTILKIINTQNNQFLYLSSTILCIILNILLTWICKNFEFKRFIAITSLISLMFVTHLGYDYIFYLILLAFAFSKESSKLEKSFIILTWFCIGYGYWFIWKLNIQLTGLHFFFFILNLLVLIIIYTKGKQQLKNSFSIF